MSRNCLALACAVVLSSWGNAYAQDNEILTQLYGTGVHEFFAGNYKAAHDDLTSVIDRGTTDPRAYYFRAISYLKLGRPDEAKADMEKGAELESNDIDGAYNVGRALERVQGSGRLMLEKYRLEARLAAHARQQNADRQRYERSKSNELNVLRNRVNVPLDGGPATVEGPRTGESVTPATAEVPVEQPAKTPAADPFGDESAEKPAATTPAADPFGEAPAEKPAAAPAADPFGGAAPTEKPADTPAAAPADDPFGAAAPADEPEMKKEDAPAPADDPFGAAAPAAAPADDPFGAAAPADAPADDPFGDDTPAEKPAADAPVVEDDPFAE